MGNCAGYCVGDDAEEKKKVTVQQQLYNPYARNLSANANIPETEKAQEFEIEYAGQTGMGNAQAVKGGKSGAQLQGQYDDQEGAGGPVTLPNGSVYTG